MESIRIRPREPADDLRLTEISSAIGHDRPPHTVEELQHSIDSQPPEAEDELFVAERDGRVVGVLRWGRMLHVKQEGTYWGRISVDPAEWGRGVGRTLYAFLMERAGERGVRRLYGTVREDLPQAQSFLERRGFRTTGHGDRISRLDVQAANLEKSRAAAERMLQEGIRIATLDELRPDDAFIQALYEMDNEAARDIPSTEEWSMMPFEVWRKEMLEAPGASREAYWVALAEGRPVGMASLHRRSGRNADNAFTAVDRRYRGRGIARALKYQTVEWARRNGIDFIYTGNDVDNAPMLAINVDLGYQFLPRNVEMVKELETQG